MSALLLEVPKKLTQTSNNNGMKQQRRPPRRLSSMDVTGRDKMKQLLKLANELRENVEIKDRRWRAYKTYKQCFLHDDAVKWMMKSLQSNVKLKSLKSEDEIEAVEKLNQMLDAGYVSHVCNHHRFKVQQKDALFFRFYPEVMEADEMALYSNSDSNNNSIRGIVTDDSLDQKLSELEMTVRRLSANVEKYNGQLDDAHGRILVLEAAIASLGFFSAVICISTTGSLFFKFLFPAADEVHSNSNIIVVAPLVVALLVGGIIAFFNVQAIQAIPQHITVLLKIMRPSTDMMEDAFVEDIEKEESYMEEQTSGGKKTAVDRRASLMRTLSQHMSSRNMSSRQLKKGGIQMREAWDLPDEATWPHLPIMVCSNTAAVPKMLVPKYGNGPCPLGIPFEFESDLFVGKCLVRIKNVPSDDISRDEDYFLGRRRCFQSIVQGRFKEQLPVSQVLTGHEFVRRPNHLPPSWMVRAGTNLMKRLAPGAEIAIHEAQPYLLSILAATSQAVSADQPGMEQDITDHDIKEDASLFGGYFQSGQVTANQRKRHFSNPNRASEYTFDTESIYTFDFYQHLLDISTYSLDLGFTKIGLAQSLDGQPIQVMSKTNDGRYLWSFQVWHEDLLGNKKQ